MLDGCQFVKNDTKEYMAKQGDMVSVVTFLPASSGCFSLNLFFVR